MIVGLIRFLKPTLLNYRLPFEFQSGTGALDDQGHYFSSQGWDLVELWTEYLRLEGGSLDITLFGIVS